MIIIILLVFTVVCFIKEVISGISTYIDEKNAPKIQEDIRKDVKENCHEICYKGKV